MAQGSTRAVPVEVSALRLRVWKGAKLRVGWDYRAGIRNKGGIVVVEEFGGGIPELLAYSVDHCDDAMSGMDSSGCGEGVRVVVDSRHASVSSCRRHVATGGPGCPTESRRDVVAHYCHLAAS